MASRRSDAPGHARGTISSPLGTGGGAMTTPGATPILVVGAGPTGLTMACELARHGAPVRIVDKRADIDPHCRATSIHARTLEIFHDLGIVEEVVARGQAFRAFNEYANGRRFARSPLGHVDSPYPFTVSLEQSRTEMILDALLERLGVRVERQTELTALAERPDGMRVTLHHHDGREETADTPWLVACDGAHSTVRHLTHEGFPGTADPHQFALGDLIVQGPVADDEGHAFLCDTGVLYLFPLPEGRTLMVATVPEDHDGAREAPGLDAMQALMDERGPAGTRVVETRWTSYFTIHYRLARHYRHGRRVFLAGDAAHVHSPVGGLGMNTGIQDAYNLAWKLALVARERAPASMLDSYELERRAVAKDVIRTTRMMTERSEAFSHLSESERQRLYVNVTVPEAAARTGAHLEELDLDYRTSPICGERTGARRLAGGPRAGAEARDAGPLQRRGERLTLFELLRGPRHTMLLFPGARSGRAGTAEATPADLPPQTSVILDVDRALHRRYDARAECLYLIRPDGYIGYRSTPAVPGPLREHLERIFVVTS
jgi:2-polyprenyl-6-methoxyphenol hydroxylase-like FAD-dependent oxidoreductase